MRTQTGKLLWILWSAKIFQTLFSPFQICSVSLYETRHSNNQSIQSVVDRHYHFHLSRLNMISWSWHLQVQHPIIDQKIHFSEDDILSLVGHTFRYLYFDECSGYFTALGSYQVQFKSHLHGNAKHKTCASDPQNCTQFLVSMF